MSLSVCSSSSIESVSKIEMETIRSFILFAILLSTAVVGSSLYPASAYHNYNPTPYSQVDWPLGHYLNYYPGTPNTAQQRQILPYTFEYDPQTALANRAGPILTLLTNFCKNIYSGPSCPTCPECSSCSCTTCAAAPPATATLTSCESASASPAGSIVLTTAFSGAASCGFTLTTFAPFTKYKIRCTNIAGGLTFTPASLTVSPTGTATANTDYTVTGTFIKINIASGGDNKPACTWTALA